MLGTLAFYAPKLYYSVADSLEAIYNHHPHLRRNYQQSVFPAATFNLGPRVVTLDHLDCQNLPYGWCSIWAGGRFDPKIGGHLVLYDLGLVIEFPSGSTILIPSSTIRHGNTWLPTDAKRVSMTQYIPGGLIRWYRYQFRCAKDLSAAERKAIDGTPEERVWEAVNLWSLIGSLREDRLFCSNGR